MYLSGQIVWGKNDPGMGTGGTHVLQVEKH